MAVMEVFVGILESSTAPSGTFDDVKYSGRGTRVFPDPNATVEFQNVKPVRPFPGDTLIETACPAGSVFLMVRSGGVMRLTVMDEIYATEDCP